MLGKLPSKWEGRPQIPSAACSVSSAIFWPFGGDVRPDYSHIRPSVDGHEAWFVIDPVIRLGSALSVMTVGGEGALTCTPTFPFFRRHPRPPLLSASPLFLIDHSDLSPVPMCLSEVFLLVSGGCFCLPPVRAATLVVAWLPTDPACCLSLVS
jgi:hypothetical protein